MKVRSSLNPWMVHSGEVKEYLSWGDKKTNKPTSLFVLDCDPFGRVLLYFLVCITEVWRLNENSLLYLEAIDVLDYTLMGVGKLIRWNNLLLGVYFIPGSILGIWQTSFHLISKEPLWSDKLNEIMTIKEPGFWVIPGLAKTELRKWESRLK